MITGIPVSEGIGIGKAVIVKKEYSIKRYSVDNTETEIERFIEAIDKAKKEISDIKKHAEQTLGLDKAMIFDAHLLILDDPEFVKMVKEKIQQGTNAEWAVDESAKFYESLLLSLDDEYMRERASDIKDVSKRLIRILSDESHSEADLKNLAEGSIIVAEDLTPSETAQMDKTRVAGFVTQQGGKTSHTAIIARTYEIPAIVGVKGALEKIKDGDVVIVDGYQGTVLINPDKQTLEEYEKRMNEEKKKKEELKRFVATEVKTKDGKRIKVYANIALPDEAEIAIKNGAEGIGLFRTEFLFMNRSSPPSEDEQFAAYKAVLEKMEGKPVIIRTLDVGGDKNIPYLNIENELNPFLGYRAIRLCLGHRELFKTQLKALLRASVYGDLKIMFPMITTAGELKEAKSILQEAKEELKKQGIEFSEKIEIGIMIETPAAALVSDILADEVDFFSIGTNDLIQYTLAIDRTNEKVSYLYDPLNPAVLRLIKMTVENAHKKGKEVGVCGEIASDEEIVPILIGLGIDELSVNPAKVLSIKKRILDVNYEAEEDKINMYLQRANN
ncbi:phosphoenolpyruvate-protein phosphotransferase [Caldicellulosiruptor saccharolyticus DSM 8903]|uniref:Phosphoenolpyruvate-protein phosphotransferase n=1 Tax=Caldicellulosiruptor saccharolyticus (strain ATCC 43494 / DSM 8903 / Tp8T 6331) TaxID=351627 RepID=A4XM79_CALS8|nr:phosphoenolpyruvate--protein phosphotransferase [Caldicellulosiruptor saccharolyticus]ABP68014.1 phosphoenolpyruvate-protein phosphotransferase [Caldicellulosiruptor saccharolyticus DSM 8903]